mmetsp:Transcript_56296/g.182835  ORF Transcript_56296/g.182835 Transcript_56296/m.182835 type:complete len:277 (+) Transcript_56296:2358-3188(+)
MGHRHHPQERAADPESESASRAGHGRPGHILRPHRSRQGDLEGDLVAHRQRSVNEEHVPGAPEAVRQVRMVLEGRHRQEVCGVPGRGAKLGRLRDQAQVLRQARDRDQHMAPPAPDLRAHAVVDESFQEPHGVGQQVEGGVCEGAPQRCVCEARTGIRDGEEDPKALAQGGLERRLRRFGLRDEHVDRSSPKGERDRAGVHSHRAHVQNLGRKLAQHHGQGRAGLAIDVQEELGHLARRVRGEAEGFVALPDPIPERLDQDRGFLQEGRHILPIYL